MGDNRRFLCIRELRADWPRAGHTHITTEVIAPVRLTHMTRDLRGLRGLCGTLSFADLASCWGLGHALVTLERLPRHICNPASVCVFQAELLQNTGYYMSPHLNTSYTMFLHSARSCVLPCCVAARISRDAHPGRKCGQPNCLASARCLAPPTA